jgi:HEAT repeat protein
MSAMHRWPIAIAAACVALTMDARPSSAQGRVSNSRIDTRPAAQGLEREIRSVAAAGGVKWIGYRAPMVAGHRRMCCFDTISDSDTLSGGMCRLESGGGVSMSTGDRIQRGGQVVSLEPATEFLILARFENGTVTRVRTFTPDCDIDAGGMPITWLTDVKPDESVAWLSSLVTSTASGEAKDRVVKTALSAVALHNVPSADRALESFVASNRPEWLRGDTAFWLGSTRGDAGARLLQKMIAEDPSDSVRDKVTFGLSVSATPSALTTLINTARNDQSRKVRGQALFWLAQKAGKEAVAAITGAIDNDPDTEVKKKAVFALSQLPKDQGVPKLIEIARSNRNSEVRKQAMFWLGQSNDPRAVKFFEDVLLKK